MTRSFIHRLGSIDLIRVQNTQWFHHRCLHQVLSVLQTGLRSKALFGLRGENQVNSGNHDGGRANCNHPGWLWFSVNETSHLKRVAYLFNFWRGQEVQKSASLGVPISFRLSCSRGRLVRPGPARVGVLLHRGWHVAGAIGTLAPAVCGPLDQFGGATGRPGESTLF